VLNENDKKLLSYCNELPRAVGQIAGELKIATKNVSVRLERLEKAGLINVTRRGQGRKTIVRTNEGDEILLYAPQFKDLYWEIKCKYEYFLGQIEGFYNAIKHIDDHKEFAMLAKNQIYSGALFCLKHGKVDSARQYLANMNIKHLEEMLELKWKNL